MSAIKQQVISGAENTRTITATTGRQAQTFIVHASYLLDAIALKLTRSGDIGTVTVSLKVVLGGEPSGADLCFGTKDSVDITTGAAEWYTFTMNTSVTVDANTMYAVVVKTSNAATLTISGTATGTTYSEGVNYTSADGGSTWSTTSHDMWIKTYGASTAVAQLVAATDRCTIQLSNIFGLADDGTLAWIYDTGGSTIYRVLRHPVTGYFWCVGTAADNGDGNGTRNLWVLDTQGNYVTGYHVRSSAHAYDIDIDDTYVYIGCYGGAARLPHDLSSESTFGSGTVQAIKVDSDGNVYIGGGGLTNILRKYDSSLTYQWQVSSTSDTCKSIDILSNDDVIIGTSDYEVRLYKSDGSSPAAGTWQYVFNAGDVRARVANGDIIYAVQSNAIAGVRKRFAALNSSGVEQWSITTAAGDIERVAFDSSYQPYVAASYQDSFSILKVDLTNHKVLGLFNLPGGLTVNSIALTPDFAYSKELKDDILFMYTMNDNAANTTVVDESENGRNGTATKNTSVMSTTGKMAEALNFVDTDADEVNVGDLSVFDLIPGRNQTYSFWYNWDGTALADYSGFISKYAKEGFEYKGVIINLRDGSNQVVGGGYFPTSNLRVVNVTDAALLTGWHLVVLRIDRAGSIWLSIDNWTYSGYSNIKDLAYVDASNSKYLSIGGDCGVSANYDAFNGKIDCVAVWNRLITEEEEAVLWDDGSGTEDFGFIVAPVITVQPTAMTHADVGDIVNLSITATGEPAPTYQWYKDGSPISGETSDSISFTAANDSGGSYTCIATNEGGDDTSDTAVVIISPGVSDQSPDTDAYLGALTTLFVVATGTSPFTYQWYKNGVSMAGATSASLQLYSAFADAGTYKCTITNPAGSVTSADIVLTVANNPYTWNPFNLSLDIDRTI